MQLVDVRIKNYKCILDSETFTVDQMTCLVGKNESGKSAILQALYKLNPVDKEDIYDALYEYPKMYQTDFEAGEIPDGNTVLISHWKFTENEITEIDALFGSGFVTKSTIVTITNGYDNHRSWSFEPNFEKLFTKKTADFAFGDPDRAQITKFDSISDIRTQLNQLSVLSDAEQSFKDWFDEAFPNDKLDTFSEKYLLKYLPKFSYFAEYQKLPGKIAINRFISRSNSGQLTKNEKVFEALLSLANSSVEEIKDSNRLEALINKTRGISSKITREIFSYWSQNKHLRVEFRYDMAKPGDEAPYNDGYIFSTRIENTRHDSSVSFDDRSAGFVWFFSFLIWFNYLQKKEDNLIILLDEPGLTLHAKAQGDLIRFFKEKITPKFQLLYTTHSPFMLDFSDILTDYHNGDKNKIDRLKKSGLLSANRVFLASDYTQYPTSDIEDIIGKEPYIKLVNACYGLSADAKINGKNIKDGDVLHSVENVLSSNSEIRFDHYRPSMYLIQNPDIWTEKDISSALDRFEKLCTDINEAL